jgi:predicted nucleic acid-binding protein
VTRALADSNVILDLVLARQPFAKTSAQLSALAETGATEVFISAHAVTTIYYVISRLESAAFAKQALASLLKIFRVATVGAGTIDEAMQMPGPDFEDCVTAAAARRARCELIVTRDIRGFRSSPVKPVNPEAALAMLRR